MERGNTQKGVNRAIARFLDQKISAGFFLKSLFDIPCGQGEFLRGLRKAVPSLKMKGLDLFAEPHPEIRDVFVRGDAREPFAAVAGERFSVMTCISGVMCFDHVSGFFRSSVDHLEPGGYLIVTNDNVLTVRDRLSFLFLGRLKRFKLLYSVQEGNWNVVLIQGLWKQFRLNGYRIEKVEYVSFYAEDLLFLPLAALIYPIWLLSLLLGRGEMTRTERLQLFPFRSLLARHYIIYAKKD